MASDGRMDEQTKWQLYASPSGSIINKALYPKHFPIPIFTIFPKVHSDSEFKEWLIQSVS